MRNPSIFALAFIGAMSLLLSTSLAPASEIVFPPTHPPTAVSDTWSSGFSDTFNIYVWRENGHVWIEIEPLSGTAFFCGGFFSVVQHGVQLPEIVALERSTGHSFGCGPLYSTTIFRLVKYLSGEDYVDDPQAFTLYFFNQGLQTYSIDIPAVTDAPEETLPVAPILTLAVEGNMVTIAWNSVPSADGYIFYFAPYPDVSYIGDIDVGNLTGPFVLDLPPGAAFYVAVQAYNSAGNSGFSNIEYFIIP